MIITRAWAMPNKKTFQIPPIKQLIKRYARVWVDPFTYPYTEDALICMGRLKSNSCEGVLFDPPYSPRQLKECYNEMGQSLHDSKSSVWSGWKDEAARIIKPGGFCISFGWSSNGLGYSRKFEKIEILLVAHGGSHNDTICTVEQKSGRDL